MRDTLTTKTMKAIDITSATEDQKARANAMFARCPHMTYDRHLEIIVKQDSKKEWQPMSKKDVAKLASRQAVEAMKEIHLTLDGVDYGSDIYSYNEACRRKLMSIR